MIRRYSVQTIAIILVAIGLFYLYYYRDNYRQVFQNPEFDANFFIDAFLYLIFNAIAIYGGIELFRLQEIGRKLAMIWFAWVLMRVVIAQLRGYSSGELAPLASFELKYLIPILGVYLLYAASLIWLSSSKVIEMMSYDEARMQRVGKILSFGAPGLGRAFTGNFLVGMILFLCYVFMLKAVFTELELTKTLSGIVTWAIFSSIDSAEVKKMFDVEETNRENKESEAETEGG